MKKELLLHAYSLFFSKEMDNDFSKKIKHTFTGESLKEFVEICTNLNDKPTECKNPEDIRLIHIGKKRMVVKIVHRNAFYDEEQTKLKDTPIPEPNFRNMNVALCGILKTNETFEHWKKRAGYIK